MTEEELDYVMLAIEQAKEVVQNKINRNNCNRNLKLCIERRGVGEAKKRSRTEIARLLMDGPLDREFVKEVFAGIGIDEKREAIEKIENIPPENINDFDYNLNSVFLAVKHAKEGKQISFSRDVYTENLKIMIEQHWQKNYKNIRDDDKRNIPIKSKKACKLDKTSKAYFNKQTTSEHVVPQKIILDGFLLNGPLCKDYIEKVLNKLFRLVAVTKGEDGELNAEYLSSMPKKTQTKIPASHDEGAWTKAIDEWTEDDTWARYREIGIELCECKECKKCEYYPEYKI